MLNLEKKDKASRDLEQSSIFCELQYTALGEQLIALKRKQGGIQLQLHPLLYLAKTLDRWPDFIKTNPCIYCKAPFPQNDIVVATCRHLYHPWCIAIHCKANSKCYESTCEVGMSLEWYLSFGFGEFDQDMKK
jgi:hypothetical protein